MRKVLLFIGLTVISLEMLATCPLRRYYSVRQSDGTTIEVRKNGNGRFAFYSNREGIALMRAANGDFHYAQTTLDGLCASGILAHNSKLRSTSESLFIQKKAINTQKAYAWLEEKYAPSYKICRSVDTQDGIVPFGTTGPGVVESIGAPVIPVIMVSFPDRDFMPQTTPQKVGRLLNEQGYSDEKFCKGSVKDYFTAQSNGLFSPSFKVVAQVKVSKPYRYYGENYANGSIDKQVKGLVQEALDSAFIAGVDFGQFTGKDGRVPLVSIYYAGPGEHSSFEKGCEDYIWAHFSRRNFVVNGVGVNSYFVGNETLQDYRQNEQGEIEVTSVNFDGMGIFVHEFGHALGLPDFYSTARDSSEDLETMRYWSVMDYGQYFYDSYAPVGYNAFERASLGWQKVQELTEPQHAELFTFGEDERGATAYCIKNKANPAEYYLLENRQPGTWYSKLLGKGMLITHVDYDDRCWKDNTVNTEKNHQRFEFVPADNKKSALTENGRTDWNGMKADLFPGLNNVTEFTDATLPAANVYTGGMLNQPIYNIKENNGIVSFSFMDKTMTGVDQIMSEHNRGAMEVYTLDGRKAIPSKHLSSGVYVIRKNGKTYKSYIK